jgi:hypothetical protein
MFRFNLNSSIRSCKKRRKGFKLLGWALAALVLIFPGCTEETSSGLPQGFTYDGTYLIREVNATRDNVVVYSWDRNAAIGLLQISGDRYDLELSFSSDAYGYGTRSDQGTLVFENSSILFMNDSLTAGTVPRGTYDIEKDWLRINYISSEFLWTEIWKRAEPVDESLNQSAEKSVINPLDILSPE